MKVLLTATVQSHICQFHKPLVQVLYEHGCEVHVAARDNLAEKNGLKLDFVDKVYNVSFSRSPKSKDNINAYKQLMKIIDDEHYDVIHCNTPMGGIVTRLAARKTRKNGTKVYYTAHGFHFYEGAPIKNWIFFYPIEKFFSRFTDKLITITTEDYNIAEKKFHCKVERIHGVGANSDKFTLLTQDEKIALRNKMGFVKNEKIVLNVGELLPNKNQKSVIFSMKKVVEKIPDSMLLIAGNGREKDRLQDSIDENNLSENVKLLGYVTNLQQYMNIADILVACSYREGLPLNLMEAMLCKKPIVASLNRGHKELVHNGENGFLVEADDITGYAEHIVRLLKDEKLRLEMGEKGYEIGSGFTDVNVKRELKEIYELQ